MLAYDMNEILRIIPDAVGLVKEASLSQEFPIDNPDSALASALRVDYLTKVAGEHVAYPTREKVAQAVEVFGLSEKVEKYGQTMTKYASAKKLADQYDETATRLLQEEIMVSGFGYGQNLVKQAEYANRLVEKFGYDDLGDMALRYSSSMYFDENQLLQSLEKRAFETKDNRYNEIKDVVVGFGVDTLNAVGREKRASVAAAITRVDSELHYNGDIYKEAFVKEASVQVKLKTKTVSFTDIQRLGKDHIGDILGKDVASALTGDPANDKAVIEALPIEEKAALERFV